MTDIRTAIEGAGAYLTEHPEEARYTDSAATARMDGGLRIRVTGPAAEELVTDMPGAVGGDASAPSPGWYLRAAVAACVTSLAVMRAAQLDSPALAARSTSTANRTTAASWASTRRPRPGRSRPGSDSGSGPPTLIRTGCATWPSGRSPTVRSRMRCVAQSR